MIAEIEIKNIESIDFIKQILLVNVLKLLSANGASL